MSRRPDAELDSIFGNDPELEEIANLLRSSRLNAPQLDPGFRMALRRRVMVAAYNRYDDARRPSRFSRLFAGPRFALATAALAVLLIGLVYLQSGRDLFGTGTPTTRVYTNTQLVALDQPITVSFSQAMDHQSVQQAIRIEPATQVTYQWQGNNLLIQPVAGQLAANTQYHITVAAQATTANHAPIGQAANIAVVTTALPSPKPSPTATPTPEPRATITGERSLPGTSGAVAGWSADGNTVFFLAQNGDLTSIRTDGQALKVLATGVARAWVSSDGRIAFAGRDGKLMVTNSDGTNSQSVGSSNVTAAGWKAGKLLVLSAGKVAPAGGEAIVTLPDQADVAEFSPDVTKLVYRSGSRTVLLDVATQKFINWPAGDVQKLTWAPDSSRLAYLAGDAVFVSQADGTGARAVTKSQGSATELAWAGSGHLLIGGPAGLQAVHPDASGQVALSAGIYLAPVGAPAGDRFGFSRTGSIWLADLKITTPGVASLDQGFALITAFETARITRDATGAGKYLTASAARTAGPLTSAGEPHLKRFFLVSSQRVADDGTTQRFLVRLILADDHDTEVRYIDEQLTLVVTGQAAVDLKIDSVADSPARPLGKGPTVNAVQVQPTGLVIIFDSDLNPETVAAGLKLAAADGSALPVSSRYAQRQVILTAQLVAGQRYRLIVSTVLKDIAGQQLAGGNYEYEFTAPAISG